MTAEEFIKVWQQAGSLDEVALKLGRSKSTVKSRASNLRRAPYFVNLKKFPRGKKKNWSAIREMVARDGDAPNE